jgi:hypothetical protein
VLLRFASHPPLDLSLEGEMLLACAAPEFVRLDPQRTRDSLDKQF